VVNRGRYGDDVDASPGDVFQVVGQLEVLADGLELPAFDFASGVFACLQFPDARLLDVVADDLVFSGELDGQRQADIAEANDGDCGLSGLQIGLELLERGWHDMKISGFREDMIACRSGLEPGFPY